MDARTVIGFGVLLDCDSAPCRFELQSVELGVTAGNAEPPLVFRMNPLVALFLSAIELLFNTLLFFIVPSM